MVAILPTICSSTCFGGHDGVPTQWPYDPNRWEYNATTSYANDEANLNILSDVFMAHASIA